MPVTNYYTIDGQMIGYKTAAGRKDFLTNALGSVTAEVDQTGNTKTFDGRYKPYGGDLSSTGTRGKYGWVGAWGYRDSGLLSSSHYVRARHYSKTSGSWTSVDPLWPGEGAYVYVRAVPSIMIDYFGLTPDQGSLMEGLKKRLEGQSQNCHTGEILTIQYIDPVACYGCGTANANKGFDAGQRYCNDKRNIIGIPIANWKKFCIEEGPGGGLRHCIGACELYRNCGSACAETVLGGHEALGRTSAHVSPLLSDNDRRDSFEDTCMDLFNNGVGLRVSKQNGSCESLCLKALDTGNLLLRQKLGRRGFGISDINCSKLVTF